LSNFVVANIPFGLIEMYVTAEAEAADVDEMGYSMSRLELESDICDGEKNIPEVSSSQRSTRPLNVLDHEIAQITKLRSGPHELLSHVEPGRREQQVSTVKMLARREGNYSGRGRFSSADCCHVLSRYLPVNGPWLVDQMNSRAYVSQFSADGSLFVAGFQVFNLMPEKKILNLLNVEIKT
jgi:WD repeat-containing protein 23